MSEVFHVWVSFGMGVPLGVPFKWIVFIWQIFLCFRKAFLRDSYVSLIFLLETRMKLGTLMNGKLPHDSFSCLSFLRQS